MKLKAKCELLRTLVEDLKLPEGSSLSDPEISYGTDATGSPEYVLAFEHHVKCGMIQVFKMYVSGDSVTLRYEYSTPCFEPFRGSNHIEKAVEDIGRFLKKGAQLGNRTRDGTSATLCAWPHSERRQGTHHQAKQL